MTMTITSIGSPELSEQYQLDSTPAATIDKKLGQEEFLELMMAQLKNQDPMEPMDNGQFLGQMAQFSTVTGIEGMQQSLDSLTSTYAAGQTLQSTQLVGQEVLIEDSSLELAESGATGGSFELEASSGEVMLDIADSNGSIVRQVDLGQFASGRHAFSWDGLNDAGERLPPGTYSAQVSAQQGDAYTAASVFSSRIIESVEFGAGGETTLNTQRGDVLTLADIRQIRAIRADNNTTQE